MDQHSMTDFSKIFKCAESLNINPHIETIDAETSAEKARAYAAEVAANIPSVLDLKV